MASVTDVAPARPVGFASSGLGRGWEPAALMTVTLLLLSFGLVTLYSASSLLAQRSGLPDYHFLMQQSVGAAFGLVLLVVCAKVPYERWKDAAWPLVIGCFVLLVIVVAPGTEAIAPRVNGARRWIRLGPVQFQPSEFAKFGLVVWTAGLALRQAPHFRSLRAGLGPFLVVWAALLVPVVLQPDLSTAAVIAMLVGLVVFAAGARIGHFVFLGLLGLPLLWLQLGVGFRWDRILTFLDPSRDPMGAGYQVRQSLIAFGSGGLGGVGFAEGRQKFGFLPEPHNDFIFSMIGEEWGFLGVIGVTLLYLSFILIGFRVARRAHDRFGELVAVGFTSLVAVHATLHMFVGLALVPSTGLPLPLVSYGRSNLVVTLAAIGVVMSVARGPTEPGRIRA